MTTDFPMSLLEAVVAPVLDGIYVSEVVIRYKCLI